MPRRRGVQTRAVCCCVTWTASTLATALVAVSQVLAVLDPSLASSTLLAGADGNLPTSTAGLTPRELEMLALLAEDLPNKSIATHLDLSEHTIKLHVNAVLGKLGAQNRTEAAMRATRMGLIKL